jgi:zinc protease
MKTRIISLICLIALVMPNLLFAAPTKVNDNLVLLPVKNDPTVSFRIWFKVGSQNDPKGKEGLARLTASLLSDGATKKNTYEQILDKLYPLAAGYDATCSAEMTVVYGRTHKDNLAEYYPLLLDAILRPAFMQTDFDRIKSQQLNAIENNLRYSSDEELGKAVLYNTIFENTPYGHITNGLVESIKRITLDDVRAFYKKYFTKDNVVIGLGGGYEPALLEKLQKDLGSLPGGKPSQVPKPAPKPIKGINVVMVEKDAPATAISIGFPITVLRGEKDWYALAIANSWFGEHRSSSSHLYQVIREQRGLNYGDYSYIENFPGGGYSFLPPVNVARREQIFEIWIRPVPNDARHFALRAALRELRRIVDNGMTEEQFELKKNFLKKYSLSYAPTTMTRLGYALDDKFYGIKGSHLENFQNILGSLTLNDVNAAIKKYWQYENMDIAMVTKDAESFKNALVDDSLSTITYKTSKPESVLEEDQEIISFPVKVDAKKIKIVPVKDLFEK